MNFRIILFSFFTIICSCHAQHILSNECFAQRNVVPYDFFEKELQVNNNLYRISAVDLQKFLGTHYDPIPMVSAQEVLSILEHEQSTLVINVLPKSLYDDCHIAGSASAPLKELVKMALSWPRDQKIIVYCALDICDAGQKAYILLSCMGFTNVADYEGGIKEWFQLGYPTEGPAHSSYLHAKNAKLPDELLKDLDECCGIELP